MAPSGVVPVVAQIHHATPLAMAVPQRVSKGGWPVGTDGARSEAALEPSAGIDHGGGPDKSLAYTKWRETRHDKTRWPDHCRGLLLTLMCEVFYDHDQWLWWLTCPCQQLFPEMVAGKICRKSQVAWWFKPAFPRSIFLWTNPMTYCSAFSILINHY